MLAAFAMRSAELRDRLFTPADRQRLGALVDLAPHLVSETGSDRSRAVLSQADILITGWGAPQLGDDVLVTMPRLRAVVHTGGVASTFLGPSATSRGIVASNAGLANSIPVAEFTLGLILLTGKRAFQVSAAYRDAQGPLDHFEILGEAGNHRRTVGIIGASRVGRLLLEHLRHFDFDVLLHDPFVTSEEAAGLGADLVDLPGVLSRSDVVSVHAPLLPSTRGMLGRAELELIRPGAVLINTARGGLLDQDALVDLLSQGRFFACIDTTDPDVLPTGHPLYSSPHVFLTPHIAGSEGNELVRLGASATAEVARFVAGQPLRYPESLG